MNIKQELLVKVEPYADPLVARTLTILRARIQQRCSAQVIETTDTAQLILSVDDTLAPEAFRIDQVNNAVRVSGGTPRGLLYGVGKFLRTSRYTDGFQASAWRGISAPQGSLRGMYFASHFHNW